MTKKKCDIPNCNMKAEGSMIAVSRAVLINAADNSVITINKPGFALLCNFHVEHIYYPEKITTYGYRN